MDQQSIRVDRIGAESQPVVVIDNFSPDPHGLIRDAQGLTFSVMGEFYPGVRAPVLPSYFQGIDTVLASVMREVFAARDRVSFDRALYSLTTTPPAALSLAQRIPHIDDVLRGKVAVIHYLSADDLGGTAFYRHRSTGLETVTAENHRVYMDALQMDFATHGEPRPAYIDGDSPIFAETARYAAVFNRALIYSSSLLHCALAPNDRTLSGDPAKGRLTVASFLSIA